MLNPGKRAPWQKMKKLASMLNKEQGMEQFTKIHKGVEFHSISVGVEARSDACG